MLGTDLSGIGRPLVAGASGLVITLAFTVIAPAQAVEPTLQVGETRRISHSILSMDRRSRSRRWPIGGRSSSWSCAATPGTSARSALRKSAT